MPGKRDGGDHLRPPQSPVDEQLLELGARMLPSTALAPSFPVDESTHLPETFGHWLSLPSAAVYVKLNGPEPRYSAPPVFPLPSQKFVPAGKNCSGHCPVLGLSPETEDGALLTRAVLKAWSV
jgi:hypothetical protein